MATARDDTTTAVIVGRPTQKLVQHTSPRPSHLFAFIGGYTGESYELYLKGDTLVYRAAPDGYRWSAPERIVPSEARWRVFESALDAARVGAWAERYDYDTLDGTRWSFEITCGDRTVVTGGDSGFPGDDFNAVVPRQSKRFLQLVRALSGLVGRKFE